MAIDFSAISAAAAALQQQKKSSKSETKRAAAGHAKRVAPSRPKTDTKKVESGAGYVIPAEFKQAIEGYLLGRGDMAQKMARRDKSIDKCCEFIYSMMLKRAMKMGKNGERVVGMSPTDAEIFGLAVHYYDEPNEALEREAKDGEG